MYGGVRGRKTKVGEKLLRFPPTRFFSGMLRLQHLLRFALRTFGFCNLSGVRVNNER